MATDDVSAKRPLFLPCLATTTTKLSLPETYGMGDTETLSIAFAAWVLRPVATSLGLSCRVAYASLMGRHCRVHILCSLDIKGISKGFIHYRNTPKL